jgi:hypothetical protein
MAFSIVALLFQLADRAKTDDLDDVMEKLDMLMATQPMKPVASLHATNAVKRSGDGGAASQ